MRSRVMLSMTLASASALWACGAQSPPAPTPVPTAPAATTLISVNGVLRGETPAQTRIGPYDSPVAGGEILVVDGPAAGSSIISDPTGAFELQVPAGPLRLRFSMPGFKTQTSSSYTAVASRPISLGKVVLDTAPWVIAGLASDSRGLPIAGAAVSIDVGGAFPDPRSVTTDANGRYRFETDRAHFSDVWLGLSGTALEPFFSRRTPCCNTDGDTVANLTTLRVLRVIAVSPDTLSVGDAVELPASIVQFDDGTERQIYIKPVSSDPSRLTVSSGSRGWLIRAIAAGEATLTMDNRGVTDWVRVVIQ